MSRRRVEKPSIESVYDHYALTITSYGRDWVKAQCPLPDHEDANPSASVNTDEDAWFCHACGEGGDSLTIIMRRERAGFVDALAWAERVLGSGGRSVRSERRSSSLLPRSKGSERNRGTFRPPWLRGGAGPRP